MTSGAAVAGYALRLGDDALILAQRLARVDRRPRRSSKRTSRWPTSRSTCSARPRALLTHAGEVEGNGRTEDDLAFLRDEREFSNLRLVEQPRTATSRRR